MGSGRGAHQGDLVVDVLRKSFPASVRVQPKVMAVTCPEQRDTWSKRLRDQAIDQACAGVG
jgi:hypothetical protein